MSFSRCQMAMVVTLLFSLLLRNHDYFRAYLETENRNEGFSS